MMIMQTHEREENKKDILTSLNHYNDSLDMMKIITIVYVN